MDTYAIVKTGGKQYRVEKGRTLLVERLAAAEGATVTLEPVMLRTEEVAVGDALKGASVKARVVAHERGEKLRVFKFKPKRGYKRRTGHRQELTRIEVTEISAKGHRAQHEPKAKTAAEPAAAAAPKADQAKAAAATKAKAAPKAKAPAKVKAPAKPKAPAKAKAAAKAKAPAKPKAAAKAKAATKAKAKAAKPEDSKDGS